MHIAIVGTIFRQLSKHIIMNDLLLRRYSVQVFRLWVFHCVRRLGGIHVETCQVPLLPRPRTLQLSSMQTLYTPDGGVLTHGDRLIPFTRPRIPKSPLSRGPAAISIEFAIVGESGVRKRPKISF